MWIVKSAKFKRTLVLAVGDVRGAGPMPKGGGVGCSGSGEGALCRVTRSELDRSLDTAMVGPPTLSSIIVEIWFRKAAFGQGFCFFARFSVATL